MRSEPLLATEPPSPIRSISEFYAVAFFQAQRAFERYGKLADSADAAFEPVRCVFEVLSQREQERAQAIRHGCIAASGRAPDPTDLPWPPIDLVPLDELSDVENSLLSTAYGAWALGVRHRERAFVFWTYVAALTESTSVRKAAEDMAREALRDGNLLRRERRLAWRAERRKTSDDDSSMSTEPSSPALLESLLLKDIFRWSQQMPAPQRGHLLSLIGGPVGVEGSKEDMDHAHSGTLEDLKRRAIRRAEQLSSIYLDEADGATDQSHMELAQQMAARSISRLADLRAIASLEG